MKELPTAEEFIKKHYEDVKNHFLGFTKEGSESYVEYSKRNPLKTLEQCFIDFTKLHVEAALKNAYDCGTFKGWTNSSDENVHKELFVKNIMSRQSIK
jgi:hypothetical protein